MNSFALSGVVYAGSVAFQCVLQLVLVPYVHVAVVFVCPVGVCAG